MYLKNILFYLLFLFILSINTQGEVINSSELTYKSIGLDSVVVTITILRNCKNLKTDSLKLYTSGIGFSYIDSNIVYTKFCKNVTPTCKGQCNKCDNNNCNSNGYPNGSNASCTFQFGSEKLVFEQLIILPINTGNMCQFRFYISEFSRDQNLTTCCSGEKIYNYTYIDRCLTPNNSSPIFSCEPTLISSAGDCLSMCFSATDMDGDSISYAMESALIDLNTSASYSFYSPAPGYPNINSVGPMNYKGFPKYIPNPSQKCSGFMPDYVFGNISFMPTMQGMSTLVFVAKEWRKINGKMQQIGMIRRDQTLIIIANVQNNAPIIKTPNFYEVCAGEKIQLMNIQALDVDTGDTVRIVVHNKIKSARDTIFFDSTGKSEKLNWEWQTTSNDISTTPYILSIEGEDDHCPLNLKTCRVLSIIVKECPSDKRIYEDLGCGNIRVSAKADSIYNNGLLQYEWIYLGKSYKTKDTVIKVLRGSPAIIEHIFYRNKYRTIYIDTVKFQEYIKLNLTVDSNQCPGNIFHVKATVIDAKGYLNYSWNGDSLTASDSMNYIVNKNKTIFVAAVDSLGCIDTNIISINPLQLPKVYLGIDTTICRETQLKISNTFQNSSYKNTWQNNDTTTAIYADSNQTYILSVVDSNGCINYDTIIISRFVPPNAHFSLIQNGKSLILTPDSLGYDYYYWNLGDGNKFDTLKLLYTYKNLGNYNIKLKVIDKKGCTNIDSQVVSITNGIENINKLNNIIIYPNPTSKYLKFQFSTTETTYIKAAIYNNIGVQIFNLNLGSIPAGNHLNEINIENLINGIYFLRIEGQEITIPFEVIKQ